VVNNDFDTATNLGTYMKGCTTRTLAIRAVRAKSHFVKNYFIRITGALRTISVACSSALNFVAMALPIDRQVRLFRWCADVAWVIFVRFLVCSILLVVCRILQNVFIICVWPVNKTMAAYNTTCVGRIGWNQVCSSSWISWRRHLPSPNLPSPNLRE
jgi:hypothetical protein